MKLRGSRNGGGGLWNGTESRESGVESEPGTRRQVRWASFHSPRSKSRT